MKCGCRLINVRWENMQLAGRVRPCKRHLKNIKGFKGIFAVRWKD